MKYALLAVLAVLAIVSWKISRAEAAVWTVHELPKEHSRYGYRYMAHVPADYEKDSERQWPLVVSLHGRGEWGDNLQEVKKRGLAHYINSRKPLDAIVVAPQTPQGQMWHPLFVDAVMQEVAQRYRVDRTRIYLTGLSMGAMGSWTVAATWPGRFAAMAPISGSLLNDIAAESMGQELAPAEALLPFLKRLGTLPVWVFHGDRDTVVDTALGKRSHELLLQAGGNSRLTIYPMTDHDGWTQTYFENPEFYPWLLAQKNTAPRWEEARPQIRLKAYTGDYVDAAGKVQAVVSEINGRLQVHWMTEDRQEELLALNENLFVSSGMVVFAGTGAHKDSLSFPGFPTLRWKAGSGS